MNFDTARRGGHRCPYKGVPGGLEGCKWALGGGRKEQFYLEQQEVPYGAGPAFPSSLSRSPCLDLYHQHPMFCHSFASVVKLFLDPRDLIYKLSYSYPEHLLIFNANGQDPDFFSCQVTIGWFLEWQIYEGNFVHSVGRYFKNKKNSVYSIFWVPIPNMIFTRIGSLFDNLGVFRKLIKMQKIHEH